MEYRTKAIYVISLVMSLFWALIALGIYGSVLVSGGVFIAVLPLALVALAIGTTGDQNMPRLHK